MYEDIPATGVELPHLLDAILRPVQCCGRRHLDRGEGTIVEVGFHPPQRGDQVGVASGKTNPPAGHVVGLGHGRELDRDVLGAGNFQHRRRRVAVKIHLGVGKVGENVDAVMTAEVDDLPVEVEVDHLRRRVRGVVDDDGDRLGHGVFNRALELLKERRTRLRRGQIAQRRPGDDEAEGVDRVGRIGHEDGVAGRRYRLRKIGQPLLGAQRHDHFAFGVEVDVEAPVVVSRQRLAQPRDATRGGVAVGARVLDRFLHLGEDVRCRGLVRVSHAEVDNIVAPRPRRLLEGVHLGEYIGRKPSDAVKVF